MPENLSPQPAACPECGASWADGVTCAEMFGVILTWEWQDPALQAEHFLLVAGYNLQHPAQFVPAAREGLRTVFIAHLDTGLSTAAIRRRVGGQAAGSTRVLLPPADRQPPVLRRWRLTIADVYHGGQSEGAAARVLAWAQAVRGELP